MKTKNNTAIIAQKDVNLDDEVYNVKAIKTALADFNELNPDEMTDRQVAAYINKFLSILKGVSLMSLVMISAGAMPISPTGVCTNITIQKNDMPGKTLLYTADAVEIRLTNNYTKTETDDKIADYVKDSVITIKQNGQNVGSFSLNRPVPFKMAEAGRFTKKAKISPINIRTELWFCWTRLRSGIRRIIRGATAKTKKSYGRI